MIDHCIAAYKKQIEDDHYKVYVTDALKVISENTAKFVGGSSMSIRYFDIINPPKEETEEKDPNEVIENIKNKITMIGKEDA